MTVPTVNKAKPLAVRTGPQVVAPPLRGFGQQVGFFFLKVGCGFAEVGIRILVVIAEQDGSAIADEPQTGPVAAPVVVVPFGICGIGAIEPPSGCADSRHGCPAAAQRRRARQS